MKLNDTHLSLLHSLCTSSNGTGTWDSRHRASLRAMERGGLVTIVESCDPTCRSKVIPLYTATVTSAGRKQFASLEK